MKKITEFYILGCVLIMVICHSCTLIDNEQPKPVYLKIDSVNVSVKSSQGAPTHNLKDVWVSSNGQLLGVFELPANIPIILDDKEETKIRVSPGFRNNGEVSRSFIYNLMKPVEINRKLQPGDVIDDPITFEYADDVIFDFVEGFESNNHVFTNDLDDDPETLIVKNSETSVEGQHCGKIHLNAEHPEIVVSTIFKYEGDKNAGADSYLEMDFKNDIPFGVGVIYEQNGEEVTQPIIVLNTKDEWHKIYVDYTLLLTSPQIENYRIYFSTNLGPLDANEGNIYIDNLKFIHR